MWGWLVTAVVGAYGLGVARAALAPQLSASGYPSPGAAEAEMEALVAAHPELCRLEKLGTSAEGRALRVLRMRAGPVGEGAGEESPQRRPRLLVVAHLQAAGFAGSFVARAVARRLAEGYGRDLQVTALLDRAEICLAALVNPDGAHRVWSRGGYSGLAGLRSASRGVDLSRNFPLPRRCQLAARADSGRALTWKAVRSWPGSASHGGPHALSEPESAALARLCRRERFCAAVHFESGGAAIEMPAVSRRDGACGRGVFEVFCGAFQSRQPHLRYRPVARRWAALAGQLDAFLLAGLGTPSVTIKVGRPGCYLLKPSRSFNAFWIANPERPERWAENDAGAAIYALCEALARSGGRPCEVLEPDLADSIPS